MTIKKIAIVAALSVLSACSFSTANMSSFKVGKDAETKTEGTSFKAGETIYANAVVANSPGKVTVKFALKADDAPPLKKGDVLPGSEVKVDLPSSGTAKYSLPIPATFQGGKFTITADMLDEKGEKKDGKSSSITIEKGAAPAPAAPASDDKDADHSDHDSKDSDK